MEKYKRYLLAIIAVPLILASFYYIFTTVPFIRYWVDDFCTAGTLNRIGFWNSQISTWNTWTGRYSATFFISFFELFGPWVVKILPILLLVALVLTATPILFSNIIFGSLFSVLMLLNAPNLIQSFFWQTGSLNYLIPFIFLNLFLTLLVSKKRKLTILSAFFLMLVAGGFSESFALAGVIFLTFILAVILIVNPKNKKKYITVVIAGTAGLVFSLIVMFSAPGNTVRGLSVTKPESLMFVINSTLVTTKLYLLRFFSIKTFMGTLGLFTIAMYFFSKKSKLVPKKNIFLMGASVGASILITTAVIGSGFYSMSIIPPDRTLFIVTTMILMCFMVFAYALLGLTRHYLDKKWVVWLLITASIAISAILIASINFRFGRAKKEIVSYANNWNREVQNLPVIRNIPSVGGLDDFTGNGGWVATCVAKYYGYKSVKIVK